MSKEEYDRLDAKYGEDARIQRRAKQLRGEDIPTWTSEERQEWQRLKEANVHARYSLKPSAAHPCFRAKPRHAHANRNCDAPVSQGKSMQRENATRKPAPRSCAEAVSGRIT